MMIPPWTKKRQQETKAWVERVRKMGGQPSLLNIDVDSVLKEIDRLRSALQRISKGGVKYKFGDDEDFVIALQRVAARALEDQVV